MQALLKSSINYLFEFYLRNEEISPHGDRNATMMGELACGACSIAAVLALPASGFLFVGVRCPVD